MCAPRACGCATLVQAIQALTANASTRISIHASEFETMFWIFSINKVST